MSFTVTATASATRDTNAIVPLAANHPASQVTSISTSISIWSGERAARREQDRQCRRRYHHPVPADRLRDRFRPLGQPPADRQCRRPACRHVHPEVKMAHPYKSTAQQSRRSKVHSMHSDEPQDRALIQAAIARHEAKHHANMPPGAPRARGGRAGKYTGGGDSGVGRLEKAAHYGLKPKG